MKILWKLYRDFCNQASKTQDMKSEMATDFLGWLGTPWTIIEEVDNDKKE